MHLIVSQRPLHSKLIFGRAVIAALKISKPVQYVIGEPNHVDSLTLLLKLGDHTRQQTDKIIRITGRDKLFKTQWRDKRSITIVLALTCYACQRIIQLPFTFT